MLDSNNSKSGGQNAQFKTKSGNEVIWKALSLTKFGLEMVLESLG